MEAEKIVHIPLDQIIPHPGNRKIGGFDQVKLEQLAESIRVVGVQQPAIVRPKGLGQGDPLYEIVAGERRWRASRIASKETIPCVVRDLDDLTVLKIQTIENLQREDVHPLDEADGYQRLIETAGYSIEQVAAELGKSVSYIYQRLKLRELAPEARKLFVDGKITAGHAILIARLSPDQQKECLGYIHNHGRDELPSIRDLSRWIQERILMGLSHATWPLDDADLVPAAGACKTCTKRTGAQPDLFADVNTENKKHDYCLDRKCFEKKTAAIVERRKAELKDQKYLAVCGYGVHGKEPKDALSHYEWNECKAKAEGAVRALIVAGEGAGRLTYAYDPDRQRTRHESSPQEKAARKREAQKLRTELLIRLRLYEAIVAKVGEIDWNNAWKNGIRREILKKIAVSMFHNLGFDSRTKMAKIENWTTAKSTADSDAIILGDSRIKQSKTEGELLRFMVGCAIISATEYREYYHPDLAPLKELAKLIKLSPEKVIAAAQEEAKPKAEKKKPAPARKDSPGGPSPKRPPAQPKNVVKK